MILLIDNYDSFTYNLVQYLGELGAETTVVRNDEQTAQEVLDQSPSAVIISPGPCDPDKAGICLELIKRSDGSVPILGVCLGHQSIGQAYGGVIVRAPECMHGKISQISHTSKSVFEHLPNPFDATRYHSLVVERESCPDCFEITAETDDGLIMGLAHKTHPVHGVQFHPESIGTGQGKAVLNNFLSKIAA